ncbi:Transcription and mRNA export factor ENY2 [Smittium culicis]|uniref:Transcription and mRNA export factor SUS1 n=1 Tax=Smittium culicis TaxID=133412 RepID=A0A1R1XX10_9FUNG|nr:Transcription and mRNA export factor ENY2 [Smittium culicis]OMJ19190.1 Transcription and mRNA export factor ENY2 [Smittium culicis]
MDNQVREEILKRFVDSGERERLYEIVKAKLNARGWQDHVRNHCKEVLKNKDIKTVTVDELCEDVLPYAKNSVSDDVKVETMEQIKSFLNKTLSEVTKE